MSKKPQHLQISSYFKEEFKTTKELEALGLYYNFSDTDLSTIIYMKTKSGVMKKKTIHTSKRNTQYINHNNTNYTLSVILNNATFGTPLEKGIDKKFSHRNREKRVSKPSLVSKLIWWLRGGK